MAKPLAGPVVEVCAVAKRALKAGETLDDYGNYMTYGEAVNSEEMRTGRYLPEGLVEGCVLKRDIAKDALITYDDITLPTGRLADRLREEQYERFATPTAVAPAKIPVIDQISGRQPVQGAPGNPSK